MECHSARNSVSSVRRFKDARSLLRVLFQFERCDIVTDTLMNMCMLNIAMIQSCRMLMGDVYHRMKYEHTLVYRIVLSNN